jgi:hypothetical protein
LKKCGERDGERQAYHGPSDLSDTVAHGRLS